MPEPREAAERERGQVIWLGEPPPGPGLAAGLARHGLEEGGVVVALIRREEFGHIGIEQRQARRTIRGRIGTQVAQLLAEHRGGTGPSIRP